MSPDEQLIQYMGNNQLLEFIELFNATPLDVNRYIGESKTYLHLSVEQGQRQIVSYLLFDVKVDANKLTKDSEMSALHIAV